MDGGDRRTELDRQQEKVIRIFRNEIVLVIDDHNFIVSPYVNYT